VSFVGTLDLWLDDVAGRQTRIGVIGLGYVGLPLALLFSEAGFPVTGFDIDPEKVLSLNAGRTYIQRIPAAQIQTARERGFHATSDFKEALDCRAILICVPTPLAEGHEPDMSFITSTVESLAPHLWWGHLVVLESTTWPGTTAELVAPLIEKFSKPNAPRVVRGDPRAAVEDHAPLGGLMLAFSPEREDPGNTQTPRHAIPKVIGAMDASASAAAAALYGTIFDQTVQMSSPAAAEMTKLLENIYRSVNIALVNELKQLCLAMNIDVWEVIEAAATKPFGFQPFYPGPGIGGHCIPVDPFYLTWRAAQFQQRTRFIELAGEVNEAMPAFVVQTVQNALTTLEGKKILILGVAYKRDTDDLRESPALTIIDLLQRAGAEVAYNDPFFPEVGQGRRYSLKRQSTPLDRVPDFDCAVLVTDHSAYEIADLVDASRLFIDTRNATRGLTSAKIVRC
jgi:UDP-N-acetyl-D-glucosamine dehydrogenase